MQAWGLRDRAAVLAWTSASLVVLGGLCVPVALLLWFRSAAVSLPLLAGKLNTPADAAPDAASQWRCTSFSSRQTSARQALVWLAETAAALVNAAHTAEYAA